MKYDNCPKCGYGDDQTPFVGLDDITLYCDNCNHVFVGDKEE